MVFTISSNSVAYLSIHFWTEFCEGTHFYVSIHLVFKPISLCSDSLLQQKQKLYFLLILSRSNILRPNSEFKCISAAHIPRMKIQTLCDHLDHTWFLKIWTRLDWRHNQIRSTEKEKPGGDVITTHQPKCRAKSDPVPIGISCKTIKANQAMAFVFLVHPKT
jgi:hypothetical protein